MLILPSANKEGIGMQEIKNRIGQAENSSGA
jgi:hypothetical protein